MSPNETVSFGSLTMEPSRPTAQEPHSDGAPILNSDLEWLVRTCYTERNGFVSIWTGAVSRGPSPDHATHHPPPDKEHTMSYAAPPLLYAYDALEPHTDRASY
jgi:hypothetical protein